MQEETRKIIKEIAYKQGLHYLVVEQIYRSTFELVRNTINSGSIERPNEFYTIFIPGLGRLRPNETKINKRHKFLKETNNKENGDTETGISESL